MRICIFGSGAVGSHFAVKLAQAGQMLDPRHRPAVPFRLSHPVVMICKARDLRQMRHTQHLVLARQLLQPPCHALCRPASDTRIDLANGQ